MPEVRFTATIGEDQMIRPPSGVQLPGGEVEVIIRPIPADPVVPDQNLDDLAGTRAWLLAVAAEAEATASSLPADMAINHDHYAHGKPLP